MINTSHKLNNKLKDIANFKHYRPAWDKVIFDLIEQGETDCFSIQYHNEFSPYDREWEMFLDCLAYFKYVDFQYPNLTKQYHGKYIFRKFIITKNDFNQIIKNRKQNCTKKITYLTVKKDLNQNLICKLKEILPLINEKGKPFNRKNEKLIYNSIARDLVYATQSQTHITLQDLEFYCKKNNSSLNNPFNCRIYEIDNMKDFNKYISCGMLVFACGKNSELSMNILNDLLDGEECFIDLCSLSTNQKIKKKYQLITIYCS